MKFNNFRVPADNFAAIAFVMCLTIFLPIVLMIIWRKKTKAKISSFFIGSATFIVFALILEQILHTIVLKATGDLISGNTLFYAIYGGLAAGIFEETGRLVSMKLFMKKNLNKQNGIMYGIGHGGAESIIIAGFTYISNLCICILLNMGQGELLVVGANQRTRDLLYKQLCPLWMSDANYFLLAGVERISAIMFHICASYIVYRAIKNSKYYLYVLAIFLHALLDAITVLLAGTGMNLWLLEGVIFAYSAIIAVITINFYRKEKGDADISAAEIPVIDENTDSE